MNRNANDAPSSPVRYTAKDIIITKFRNVDLVHARDRSACTQPGWQGPREPLFPWEDSAQERVPLPTPFLAEGWSLNDRWRIDILAADDFIYAKGCARQESGGGIGSSAGKVTVIHPART